MPNWWRTSDFYMQTIQTFLYNAIVKGVKRLSGSSLCSYKNHVYTWYNWHRWPQCISQKWYCAWSWTPHKFCIIIIYYYGAQYWAHPHLSTLTVTEASPAPPMTWRRGCRWAKARHTSENTSEHIILSFLAPVMWRSVLKHRPWWKSHHVIRPHPL